MVEGLYHLNLTTDKNFHEQIVFSNVIYSNSNNCTVVNVPEPSPWQFRLGNASFMQLEKLSKRYLMYVGFF